MELYRAYAAHLRAMIATMKRAEIDRAAEFHLFAYRILKHELTSRG